jgi:hypothetical protein
VVGPEVLEEQMKAGEQLHGHDRKKAKYREIGPELLAQPDPCRKHFVVDLVIHDFLYFFQFHIFFI